MQLRDASRMTSQTNAARCCAVILAAISLNVGLVVHADSPAIGATPVAMPQSIEVAPAVIALRGDQRRQQLLVTARMPDGRVRDVTHLAKLAPADSAIARLTGSVVLG